MIYLDNCYYGINQQFLTSKDKKLYRKGRVLPCLAHVFTL